jgi:hypothetical protein
VWLGLPCAGGWLEAGTDPEGPATAQLDHGFRWFSSHLGQMLSLHQNSRFIFLRHISQNYLQNFRPNAVHTVLSKFRHTVAPSNKFIQNSQILFSCFILPTVHSYTPYILHFQPTFMRTSGHNQEYSKQ